MDQFINEIKIQMFLDHPNIVKLYGFFLFACMHAFPQQFSGFKTNTHQAVNGSYKYTHLLNQNWFYLNCICSFFVSIVFQRFLIKISDYLTLK